MKDKEAKTNLTQHFDFKDTSRLTAHLNPHARMFSRKRTRLTAREQRSFAKAVKRARFMALVPYVKV